uniref:Uncharacterized protein n=1 Tax=Aegilops tauschii subsp. strangulata TaxID=200361 RepID=A0A453LKT9_AEGTS
PVQALCFLASYSFQSFDIISFLHLYMLLQYIEDVKAGNIKFHYCTINKRIGAGPSDLRSFDIDNHLAV